MIRPMRFTKVDLKPRRYHGYAVVLFIFGTLLPPLAVAARFGIGRDFWLNLVLTLCGYIPGHVHNFYIQNIRNNKNHRRTPKWVSRYGLVNTGEIERKQRRSQWANRYNDRLPASTLEGREVEPGQIDRSSSTLEDPAAQSNRDNLWGQEDESYYGRPDGAGSSTSVKSTGSAGRWRYPANFEDTEPIPGSKKKKTKKDRWARTEDARMGVGVDGASVKKKKKKKSKKNVEETSDFINPRRGSLDSSIIEGPEDPEGRRYGPSHEPAAVDGLTATGQSRDDLDHEF